MAPVGLIRHQLSEIRDIELRISKSSTSHSKSSHSKSSHSTSNHSPSSKKQRPGKSCSWTVNDSRSISPAHSVKSTYSNKSHHSTHSEIGDSGVSSERNSPSPLEPSSLNTSATSESDNDSNISNDSLHGHAHPIMVLKNRRQKIKAKPPISGSILRQICDRAQIFEKRRQNLAKTEAANTMLRGLVIRGRINPSNRIHHTHSSSTASSLISSASLFSSTTSLILEDDEIDDERSMGARTSMSCDDDLNSSTSPSPVTGLYEHSEHNAGTAFAGIRDIFSPPQQSTIRSHKGTVRGVRNRVRAGIATFTTDQRIRKVSANLHIDHVIITLHCKISLYVYIKNKIS